MAEFFQWLLGGVLLALGGYVSLFGVVRTAINLANQKRGVDRFVSGVPIVGPVVFSIGWLVSPLAWSWWVLLIIALDIDTLLAVFYFPYLMLFRRDV